MGYIFFGMRIAKAPNGIPAGLVIGYGEPSEVQTESQWDSHHDGSAVPLQAAARLVYTIERGRDSHPSGIRTARYATMTESFRVSSLIVLGLAA